MTSGYPLTPTQRLMNILRDRADEAAESVLRATGGEMASYAMGQRDAYMAAARMLSELDPDADWDHDIPEGASLGR
jgi:hypothetical protein